MNVLTRALRARRRSPTSTARSGNCRARSTRTANDPDRVRGRRAPGSNGQQRKETAMKASMVAVAATVLIGFLAASTPSRADEDCDTVVEALEDAQLVATK